MGEMPVLIRDLIAPQEKKLQFDVDGAGLSEWNESNMSVLSFSNEKCECALFMCISWL